MSLSSSVIHDNNPWCGNLFYFYLFNWFEQPFDMDGDGFYSILDAYKFTSFKMNQHIKNVTENCLTKYMQLYTDKIKLESQLSYANKKKKNSLTSEIRQKESEMNVELSYFTNKQESWILNANHARAIGF